MSRAAARRARARGWMPPTWAGTRAGRAARWRGGVAGGGGGVEEVGRVDALAGELGVEVEAAGREAAAPDDLVDGERQLVDRVRELVRVPAVLVVATVGVDAAEDPQRDRRRGPEIGR